MKSISYTLEKDISDWVHSNLNDTITIESIHRIPGILKRGGWKLNFYKSNMRQDLFNWLSNWYKLEVKNLPTIPTNYQSNPIESYEELSSQYYRLVPNLQPLRKTIMNIVNDILQLEDCKQKRVDDIWIIPEKAWGGNLGSSIITKEGLIVIRICIGDRDDSQIADTILHELAHICLGKKHIQKITHDSKFNSLYQQFKKRYQSSVESLLRTR